MSVSDVLVAVKLVTQSNVLPVWLDIPVIMIKMDINYVLLFADIPV